MNRKIGSVQEKANVVESKQNLVNNFSVFWDNNASRRGIGVILYNKDVVKLHGYEASGAWACPCVRMYGTFCLPQVNVALCRSRIFFPGVVTQLSNKRKERD